jgi:hypothetical protein
MTGGSGTDTFEIKGGVVQIMNYTPEDLLVVNYSGTQPVLTTQTTETVLTLLADDEPVAVLLDIASLDLDTVHMIAA